MNKLRAYTEKLTRFLNRKSLYPLVTGPWESIKTPSLIQEVINSGYFRSHLKPYTPDMESIRNIVVIAPHQDDEAIGCGGLLFKMKNRAKVTILFVTDGAQANLGVGLEESIKIREKEASKALAMVDATGVNIGLPNNDLKVNITNINKLSEELEKHQPDLLLTPWLFDRPWKHRVTNLLLYHALKESNAYSNVPLWSYQVHNVIYPNVVVDISEFKDQKAQMIRQYESQMSMIAPYDHFILGLNQWNAQYLPENKNGWAEVFFSLPVKDWLELMNQHIVNNESDYISAN